MTPTDKDQRLKLAVQKSGRLTDPSLELLKSCGLKLSRGRDQLMGFGENMPLDVLFVRDDDIPDLVQEDVCDLGLVGRNVLEEKRLELTARGHTPSFTELRTLDFGRCRLSLAVPEGFSYESPWSLAGKRIASFDYDKDELAPEDRAVLDQLAQCLMTGALKGKAVALVGRADPRGTEEYNMGLGSRRSGTVSQYLARLGVGEPQLQATTRGALDATGVDEASWQKDRRVDISLAN